MEIKELGHLVLFVRNLDASVHFYRDILGWRSISGDNQPLPFPAAAFSAPSGRTHHELLLIEVGPDAASQPAGRRVGLYHFGLKVGDSGQRGHHPWRSDPTLITAPIRPLVL